MSTTPSDSESRTRRKHKTSKSASNESSEEGSGFSHHKDLDSEGGNVKTAGAKTPALKTSISKAVAPKTSESKSNAPISSESKSVDPTASELKTNFRKSSKSASSPVQISELHFVTPESSESKSSSLRTSDSTVNTSESKSGSSKHSAAKTDNAANTDSKSIDSKSTESLSGVSKWLETKSNVSETTSKSDASGAKDSRSETPPTPASDHVTTKTKAPTEKLSEAKRKSSDPFSKAVEFFRTRVPGFLSEASQPKTATLTPKPAPIKPNSLLYTATPVAFSPVPLPDRLSWSRASYCAPAAMRLPSIPDSSFISELETPMKPARKAAAVSSLSIMKAPTKKDTDTAIEIRPKTPAKKDDTPEIYHTSWLANPNVLTTDSSIPAQPLVEPPSPGAQSPQIASLMARNVRRRPSASGPGKQKGSKGSEEVGIRSRSGSRNSKTESNTPRHVRQRISFQDRADPDEPFPATSFMSWDVESPVALYMAGTGPLAQTPITVMTALHRTAVKHANTPAYGVKVDGAWQTITFQQLFKTVNQAAKGLIKLGLDRYNVVVILGYSSTEWVVSHLAAIFAGGISASMHVTSSDEDCQLFAEQTKSRIIIVGSAKELKRVLVFRSRLQHLLAIVQCNMKDFVKSEDIYSWDELLEIGQDVLSEVLHHRAMQQAPNVCCSIVQTIGTAAAPKSVLLSHDNVTWVSNSIGRYLSIKDADGVTVSFMPLSCIVAQIMDIYIPIRFGITVYFAPETAIQGSVFDTVQHIRPTIFWSAGRLYDVLMDAMKGSWSKNVLKNMLMKLAINIGLRGYFTRVQSQSQPVGWNMANSVVCNRIRKEFGLGRCAEFVLTGGSVRTDVWNFYYGLNMDLLMSYGMTESTGQHTISLTDRHRQRSVGLEIDGCMTLIDKHDDDEVGELMLKGRNIAMGYLDMKDETAEMFTADGWFRTGDLGKRDEDGFLYVVGRIDQQIHLSTGEDILPMEIEFSVNRYLPCVHYCMAVGRNRPFLGILMTLKMQLDPETGRPTSDLSEEAVRWFGKAGSRVSSVNDIFPKASMRIVNRVQRAINRVNAKASKPSHRIVRWTFLPGHFCLETGEIGQSLAIRRWVIEEKYSSTIESLFA